MPIRTIPLLVATASILPTLASPVLAEQLDDLRLAKDTWLTPQATSATAGHDWRPAVLGMLGAAGWGLAAIPGLTGAGQGPTMATFVAGSVAAYAFEGEWLRALATPVGDLVAGTAGYFLASSLVLPLLSGKSYSTGSALGAQWAETGTLVGVGAFHLLVGWDVYRRATEKAKAKPKTP